MGWALLTALAFRESQRDEVIDGDDGAYLIEKIVDDGYRTQGFPKDDRDAPALYINRGRVDENAWQAA
jgi:hypothetical protein